LILVHLQSSSSIVTVRVALDDGITLLGSEDGSIVRLNDSSTSNVLSLVIGILKDALVFPARIVTLYGPES